MQTLELPAAPAVLDELTQLQLSVAQRADELMRNDRGTSPERDFWREAEEEIWARRERR